MDYYFSIFFFFFLYITITLLSTFFKKNITKRGIFYLLTFSITFLFFATILQINDFIFLNKSLNFVYFLSNTNWFLIDLSLSLRLDGLSYLFILLVLSIGTSTNFYILNYFKYEAQEDNFTLLINWFIISMVILVLANNLLTLFLGWELIGLTSFFLINFWNQKKNVLKSSFKAFFFNKISDGSLFFFVTCISSTSGIQNINLLNISFLTQTNNTVELYKYASIALIISSFIKSAQIVGHLWLPDSMEAPLPASALIHSATLVSAGVYLLLRFSNLITLYQLQWFIMVLGSITAAYGGVVAAAQTDLKKLLAYSTISHCGFIFVSIGMESYIVSIIYLYMHGLFKALTFFCAGSFIRVAGSQDMRLMGGLNKILPVDTIFLIICSVNLGGLPFTLGYLYKNYFIIALTNSNIPLMVLGFSFIGMLASIVYVFKIIYYTCFDFVKEFINPIILELQQKQNNVRLYWSFTTKIQIISVFFLLIFSCFIYVYFINIIINSGLIFEYSNFVLDSSQILIYNKYNIYKIWIEFFYSSYLLVVVILFLLIWRLEFSFLMRLNNIIFLYFILIFTLILEYVCINLII